jgi:hypothetical protein
MAKLLALKELKSKTSVTVSDKPDDRRCHVFISHAGTEKRGFVRFLFEALRMRFPEIKVFLDEDALEPSHDAVAKMHEALGDAFVGKRSMNKRSWITHALAHASTNVLLRHTVVAAAGKMTLTTVQLPRCVWFGTRACLHACCM